MKLLKICLLVWGILFGSTVFAQGTYMGTSYGWGKLTVSSVAPESSTLAKKEGVMSKYYAGYAWNRYWSTEVGYASFDKATVVSSGLLSSFKVRSLYAASLGRVPLVDNLYFLSRIGVSNNQSTSDLPAMNKTRYSLMFGTGLEYLLTGNLSLAFEYDVFGKVTDNVNLQMIGLSMRYGF